MSLNLHLPRLTGHGRHRAADRARQLEHQLEGAGHLIEGLRAELAETADSWEAARQQAKEERDGREAAERRVTELEAAAKRAAEANQWTYSVAAGQRDIDPDDRPTVPVDVRELRDRFETGPIRRIGVSPAATDPAHLPGAEAA